MVTTLLKSTLREIRQSLGRFLAILAIVCLGVSFLSGLRMSQPSMMATGVKYLDEYAFHDFRLLSTLGFTEEDVEAFAALDGIQAANGSWYTEFLWESTADSEAVLIAHSMTPDVNLPNLIAGRMPEKGNECLGDAAYFSEDDIGKSLPVSPSNDEDTLELLRYDAYILTGIADSPLYLHDDRGTSSIGSGSIAAFLLMPEDAFDADAFYEIYLAMAADAPAYSEEYTALADALEPNVNALLEQRAQLRYDTLYGDAMKEIGDGEQELADGWLEYRTERADAEAELADAYQKLLDGEQEYADGLADFEQGKLDYADGLQEFEDGKQEYYDGLAKYQDGLKEYQDGLKEFEDGKQEYYDGLAEYQNGLKEYQDGLKEFEDGKQEYYDGLAEYQDGLKEYQDGLKEYQDGKKEYEDGLKKLENAQLQLTLSLIQLNDAKAQLDAGDAAYSQLSTLYSSTQQIAAFAGAGTAENLIMMLRSGSAPPAVEYILQAYGSSSALLLANWNAAEAQIGTSLNQAYLSNLSATLAKGRSEYESGYLSYIIGYQEYQDGKKQLEEAAVELADAEQTLADAKVELDDAKQKLDDAWQEILDGEQELADAKIELDDARQKLDDAWQEILDGEQELADAKADLEKAPGELTDARKELDDGWKEYRDGLAEANAEFADAEKELQDGQQDIADAYEELKDLKHADTYTLTRSENAGYASFDNDIAIIAAISVVFPIFFFLVAALVCMTTMKRMVEEQRTQIGVLKAIGYSNTQIIGKYLFYSGSAAIVGSTAGYVLGSWGLPLILWDIYAIIYGFAPLEQIFDPLLAAIAFSAALLCSMGSTYLSCKAELSNHAAELLRPRSPKSGKRILLERIPFLWKRLSFLRKVSIRNVMRYRSRLMMMILGIGGCTALLVTGFGIQDSIGSIANDQFGKITLYDYAVNFQDPQTPDTAAEYLAAYGWSCEDGLLVHSGSTDVVTESGTKSVYLIIPSASSLDGFISLRSGETELSFPGIGEAVITRNMADNMGISAGDSLRLRDEKLGTVEVTVSAVCDNYMFNYIYVSRDTYLEQLETVPAYKTLLLHGHQGADPYEESVLLASGDDISNVAVNEDSRQQMNSLLDRLGLVIVVLVLFAGALAFVVLYNLTNINITERIREIATIKVLGFYQNEVATYVFREIMMLATAGSLAGLLMGKGLLTFVIMQIDVDGMFFPNQIFLQSYLISFLLTMVFTVVITWTMRPRLRKIDMAESLKSVE